MQSWILLLQLILYLTPFAAIIWYTFNERLPIYKRTYFPDDQEFQYHENLPNLSTNSFPTFIGYIGSLVKNTMSTRYWDEIDWYIQEGTKLLCDQMLPEKKEDASLKWSSGEAEKDTTPVSKDAQQVNSSNEAAQDLSKDIENLKIEEHGSDADSEKDEDYIERSTSVEDKETGTLNKQTSVDELLRLCNEFGLAPPVYTYFMLDDLVNKGQIVATIQLWNGLRLSCAPQKTRDKAMEDVASQGLAVLKADVVDNRPISTRAPYVTIHNVAPTQYFSAQPAFGSPVAYGTAPPAYYYHHHAPPYMMPSINRSIVPLSSDQQPHPLMHPHIRYGPQYAQFVPNYPYMTTQISPTHQAKLRPGIMPPAMWNYYPNDYLQKDIFHKPKTEFKILDEPPVSNNSEEKPDANPGASTPESSNVSNSASRKSNDNSTKRKGTSSKAHKQESQSKVKLAISFNQETM